MFKKILVALDHSKADRALLPKVKELARLTGAELLLFHVSTGWAAEWRGDLNLADTKEMKEDHDFLEKTCQELRSEGFQVTASQGYGEPAHEILALARQRKCDLIAMTTHGHRLISDLIHGTTITKVRHESEIPIFLVKAEMD
jgi:nucleotide-binding universal stress UspA family protein